DLVVARGGSYYLTYHEFPKPEQVIACYPQFKEFLELKRKYDQLNVFRSLLSEAFRKLMCDSNSCFQLDRARRLPSLRFPQPSRDACVRSRAYVVLCHHCVSSDSRARHYRVVAELAESTARASAHC